MTDVCATNHGGNPQSVAAFRSRNRDRHRERVFEAICEADEGLTVDELAAQWLVEINQVAPRFSELKRDGRIIAVDRRPTRTGCTANVFMRSAVECFV